MNNTAHQRRAKQQRTTTRQHYHLIIMHCNPFAKLKKILLFVLCPLCRFSVAMGKGSERPWRSGLSKL